jgi:hypothetical protein
MRIKPRDRLDERLLLGILLHRLAQIASHREAMDRAAIKIDLIRQLRLLQYLLGFMSFLSREDLIRLSSRDGKGAGDGG